MNNSTYLNELFTSLCTTLRAAVEAERAGDVEGAHGGAVDRDAVAFGGELGGDVVGEHRGDVVGEHRGEGDSGPEMTKGPPDRSEGPSCWGDRDGV